MKMRFIVGERVILERFIERVNTDFVSTSSLLTTAILPRREAAGR
jgi:hypothetical protein